MRKRIQSLTMEMVLAQVVLLLSLLHKMADDTNMLYKMQSEVAAFFVFIDIYKQTYK